MMRGLVAAFGAARIALVARFLVCAVDLCLFEAGQWFRRLTSGVRLHSAQLMDHPLSPQWQHEQRERRRAPPQDRRRTGSCWTRDTMSTIVDSGVSATPQSHDRVWASWRERPAPDNL